jgi:hypothetical protein
MQLISQLHFSNQVRSKSFSVDKDKFPLDYHKILGQPWQHFQDMIRLPDAKGKQHIMQYYMGTFSQSVEGDEGGMVFIGEYNPESNKGEIIWIDVLKNSHPSDGFNHPGDLRRVGDVVIIAGQNWNGDGLGKEIGKWADHMKLGKGGQAILFYDVSSAVEPKYMGKLTAEMITTDANKINVDISDLTASKVGDYYYLGFENVKCFAKKFSHDAKWTYIPSDDDIVTDNPIEFEFDGRKYIGSASLKNGNVVSYKELLFTSKASPTDDDWGSELQNDCVGVKYSDTIFETIISETPFSEKSTFSLNPIGNGRSAVVYTDIESDGTINIAEIESIDSTQPITGLELSFGEDSAVSAGYEKINTDLNKGAGGKYIFLAVSRDLSLGEPITNIHVRFDGEKNPSEDYVNVQSNSDTTDLNKGAGGADVYMSYSREKDRGKPIKQVGFIQGENPIKPVQWEIIEKDLNEGASSLLRKHTYLWLVFTRH